MQRIAFRGITVDFGATRALDDVEFAIAPGEVVGLLGHNGAGKSTLVGVAAGVLRPTSGSFELEGETVEHATPHALSARGLTVVNQEPALVGSLSIHDNLFLGRAGIARRERPERARDALTRVGLGHVPPGTLVAELSIGERQLVDLARGLVVGDVKVLFLDEPTAALGAAETENLHSLIREFSDAGTAVVYVSHRLPDILDVCTRAVVLNGGRVVRDTPTDTLTVAELSHALAPGFSELEAHTAVQSEEVALEIDGPSRMRFRRGEIVGLFGMAAGNQFKLMESLFGWRQHAVTERFSYSLEGSGFAPASPRAAIRSGVMMVPADRERDGLLTNLSARENVLLPWFRRLARAGAVMPSTGGAEYERSREEMRVHGPEGSAPIGAFSGGNRQKHLLSRWIYPYRPRVLLLNQPTQGVDIGAKNDIVRALRGLAESGVTIVVASSESDEIARMCSRAYVIYDTAVSEIGSGPQMEEHLLGSLLDLAGR
ncbi:sugar ABC transporter ATP-binding protein [Leucobacter sp. CSA1]|uniref:Sugar ABC transporter ATP-binding protein n=1 Tax=Leucobacter chromiisoli TaxID=2796471 RepID=A0A934UVK3_9MICO|nr:sugar ABC transporter ATP-binding protein [Leucobacter chromiisoli]MBK0420005.1 sugar ABC transporter ATP-binding protein [Leucobacter chromiisoli]